MTLSMTFMTSSMTS